LTLQEKDRKMNNTQNRKFDSWFKSQFGNEPHSKHSLKRMEDEFRSATIELTKMQYNLDIRKKWLAIKDASLKAWCANEK